MKRACIAALVVHLGFAVWSTYRRLWQIQRIELSASAATLIPGTIISYDVVTSGEVRNRIVLELVQGDRIAVLREERARVASISAYDPRLWRYQRHVRITPDLLARFQPGPATLRLTGFGSQKLLRTPAPRVRELLVTIPNGRP